MSKIALEPYLFFSGQCREAFEFYKGIFGGEISLMTVGDVPAGVPGMEGMNKDFVMNAELSGGEVTLRGSDSANASPATKKVELCLGGTDEPNLRKIFDGLSAGGTVKAPLEKMFWGDTFGSLTDKYGVDWMMNISSEKP